MHTHLYFATMLAELLDDKFHIGKFRFGLDPILGLIPGVGDAITIVLAFYIVWIAKKANLPEEKIARMIHHITVDAILGFIPIVGDLADFVYKANKKNLAILKEHLATMPEVVEGKVIAAA